jgi:hypothetical protein
MFSIAPLLLTVLFAQETFPDPAKLIHDAIVRSEAQDKRHEKYTWREDDERPDEKTKTYESIMLEGENYRKLILASRWMRRLRENDFGCFPGADGAAVRHQSDR